MFKQLAKESVVYGLAKILVAALGFATLPFYTRVFSLADYGTIAIVGTLAAMLPILYGLSLETAYTRFFNDSAYSPDAILEILMKFQVIYGAAVMVSMGVLGQFFVTDLVSEELWRTFLVILVGALLAQFVTLFQTVARMRHAVLEFTVISLSSAVLGALFSVSLVYWRPTLMSYFLGAILSNGVALAVCFRMLRLPLNSFWKAPFGRIRPLLKFSLPLIPAAVATYLNSSLDQWTLAYILSSEEVAIYSVGMKLSTIITMGNSILMFAFMPHSMKLIHLEKSKADNSLEMSLRYFSVLACVGAILLQAITPYFIGTVVPAGYSESAYVVGILALGSVFFSYTYFSVLGSWKSGYPMDYSYSVVVGLGVNAILNFALIPIFGIIGAAIATAIGMLSTCFVSFYLSHRRHAFEYSFGRLAITNIISIIAVFVCMYAISHDWSTYSVVLGSLITLLILTLINLTSREVTYLKSSLWRLVVSAMEVGRG
jgi:O-antigen/teichoic acid export membrane protein